MVVLAALAASAVVLASGVRSDGESAPRSWPSFCAEARRVAVEVAHAPDARSRGALRAATARVRRLVDVAPSSRLRRDLVVAMPVLTAPFAPTRTALTSPRLLATDDVDTALATHCRLGRAIFVPPAPGVFGAPGPGLSTS